MSGCTKLFGSEPIGSTVWRKIASDFARYSRRRMLGGIKYELAISQQLVRQGLMIHTMCKDKGLLPP